MSGFRNPDLHCHSNRSDGFLAPGQVVERALANGVDLLALTDHDEVSGIDEALAAAEGTALRLLPGVEISVSFAGETIHIVGLDIDHRDADLVAALRDLRAGRSERASRMSDELARCGIRGALAGARALARNPELVSRAHFARYIVSTGLMPDVKTVFDHYLATGKPGYVEHQWSVLEDAVGWIRGAGGLAVLAHPARYRLSATQMKALLDRFQAAGGEGIEVVGGAHTPEEMQRFATVARQRHLLASRASDFHGVDESRVDLGGCNPLPQDLVPVWSRFCEVAQTR
ncbi:MAG: PHP domain-containing protein [Rhodocyclaceae bacterium]|nr:PHP domain-containing protein [Rhodocyclaceae bacterium]